MHYQVSRIITYSYFLTSGSLVLYFANALIANVSLYSSTYRNCILILCNKFLVCIVSSTILVWLFQFIRNILGCNAILKLMNGVFSLYGLLCYICFCLKKRFAAYNFNFEMLDFVPHIYVFICKINKFTYVYNAEVKFKPMSLTI